MIDIKKGTVIKIKEIRDGVEEILVDIDGIKEKAINYINLTGRIKKGDIVYLNTTAGNLKLGTGGYHFVMINCNKNSITSDKEGHIMKMRYTPFQIKCFCVEEQQSPYHNMFLNDLELDGLPVIICELHSMVPCAAASVKINRGNNVKIAYIMTDGGCLPISFSKLVDCLKKSNLIDYTITIGHAFGGDYEAVNIYTGLIAAKYVIKSDIVITAMGPGIVGTGTKYGFTGIEQGEIINAVGILKGIPIAIPRISFSDKRDRHIGVSHHTLTILKKIALLPAIVPLHRYSSEKLDLILSQFRKEEILNKHRIRIKDGWPGVTYVKNIGFLKVTTMGRSINDDPEFFLTSSAAGIVASEFLKSK
ncbi:MAG: DUF3866 family protein [Firmicutes bacterium]|nr:DUF3866 family protein [Bacillota bacterium]